MRPDLGEIHVEDTLSVDRPVRGAEFALNAGLEVETADGRLEEIDRSGDGTRVVYRLRLAEPSDRITLSYRGRPVFGDRRGMGDMPVGEVSTGGVYLDSHSAWYPLVDDAINGLDLRVRLPVGWQSISIGRRGDDENGMQRWRSEQPHDDIYLIAGRYTRHAATHNDIDLSVWLLQDDAALAERYLGLMGDYIDHYSRLIGEYPYAKFAVVENRWQTGYGMPSFTLLGSRVIRLPFIPYTSLPHEILHNWWGNGVWVDYAKGNWSEGLTAYLADHWMKERRGRGADYRLKALQRYTNFAAEGRDSPLLAFVSRHGDASQSIGYSKSLMLFHMLRRHLGDAAFVDGLQRVWQRYRFDRVGFETIVATLLGGDPGTDARWQRWLTDTGAARLAIGDAQVEESGSGYRLTFELIQQQDEPYVLDIPVAVMLEGGTLAAESVHRVERAKTRLSLQFERRPLRLDVDPRYDLLRLLDPSEQPAALNRLFGTATWLVLPTDADAAMQAAWADLARAWQRRYPSLQTIDDRRADTLPANANLLLLGWENRLLPAAIARLQRADHRLEHDGLQLGETFYAAADHAVALVANDDRGVSTGLLGAPAPDAVAALARKLPHYGSYGRLVFDAGNAQNRVRDSLPSPHSRLSRRFAATPIVDLLLPDEPVLEP